MKRPGVSALTITIFIMYLTLSLAGNQMTGQACYAPQRKDFKTIIANEKELDPKWKAPSEKGSVYKVSLRSFDESFMRGLLEKNSDTVVKIKTHSSGYIGIRGKKYSVIANQKTGMLTMSSYDSPNSGQKVTYKDDQFYIDKAVSFLKHCKLYDNDLSFSHLIKQQRSTVDLYFFFRIEGHVFNGTFCRVIIALDSDGGLAHLVYSFPQIERVSSFPLISLREAYSELLSGRGGFVYHNDIARLKGVIKLGHVTGIDLVYRWDEHLRYAAPYYQFKFEADKAGIVPKGMYPALNLEN